METLLPRIFYKDRRWRVRSFYDGRQVTQQEHWFLLLAFMDAHTYVNHLNSGDPQSPVYYLRKNNATSYPPATRSSNQ